MLRVRVLFFFFLVQVHVALATDLEFQLDQIRREHHIAGLFLILADRRAQHITTLGVTSHATNIPLTQDHYIRLGSVSKLFIGLAALRLEQSGQLDLHEPLINKTRNLPFRNPWRADHPVTFAQLMEHSAGLQDMSKPEWAMKTPLSLENAFAVDPDSRRLKWPAGLHSSYSNSGAGIAAYIIEQITKEKFEDVIQKEVFDYLGLNTATYFYDQDVKDSLITGYDTDGTTEIPYWHTLYRAFGGINIRASQMSRVLALFLNDGQLDQKLLFTSQQINRMSTPTTTISARAGLSYGYGLGLYQYHRKGIAMIGHGGDADGYLTFLGFSPVLGKGYFVVINAFNYRAMRILRNAIEDDLITEVTPLPPPAVYEMSASEINRIVGDYEEVTYRFRRNSPLVVFNVEGKLYTRQGAREARLIPVNSRFFRRRGQPRATIAISEENGRIYFESDAGNFVKLIRPTDTVGTDDLQPCCSRGDKTNVEVTPPRD